MTPPGSHAAARPNRSDEPRGGNAIARLIKRRPTCCDRNRRLYPLTTAMTSRRGRSPDPRTTSGDFLDERHAPRHHCRRRAHSGRRPSQEPSPTSPLRSPRYLLFNFPRHLFEVRFIAQWPKLHSGPISTVAKSCSGPISRLADWRRSANVDPTRVGVQPRRRDDDRQAHGRTKPGLVLGKTRKAICVRNS